MHFYTIGVYNSTEQEFLDKLIENKIDSFCDIRQRRGVRGAKYAFVNSLKLQDNLKKIRIKYYYIPKLAPTTEIRNLQKKADLDNRELKSQRQHLGPIFKTEYNHSILNNFDFEQFIKDLKANGAQRIVLFCVEELAEACHRSLVANTLNQKYNYEITNL